MYFTSCSIRAFLRASLAVVLLSGCVSNNVMLSQTQLPKMTPTLSSLFQIQPTSRATVLRPSPVPTQAPSHTPEVEDQFIERPIFDDHLAANWSLDGSKHVFVNAQDTNYAKSGIYAIATTPLQGEGQLQLSVTPNTLVRYRRDAILGISFWLSGGQSIIAPEDLGITVLGSNAFPYWDASDTSVKLKGRVTNNSPLFSETRLYYLHVKKNIPPQTWVEVTVWLDDLQFDPQYTYVTGFYIKNDTAFRDTFYIDNVRLLIRK